MGHLEKWGFYGCDKDSFGEELSWIIHLYSEWNYTSPSEAQGNWTPMKEEVGGHMDVKECQHHPVLWELEVLGWRSPTCSCFSLSSRSLSWISYFRRVDESLLTAARTFVVTPCRTMCHCGGKKSKVEMEMNLTRTAVAPSSGTGILFICFCHCVSLKESEAQFSVILMIRLISPQTAL